MEFALPMQPLAILAALAVSGVIGAVMWLAFRGRRED